MSYDMRFRGTLTFPSAAVARRVFEDFRDDDCIDESVVTPDDLRVDGAAIAMDVDTSAPASMFEATCDLLEVLAGQASGGHILAEYDGGEGPESIYQVTIPEPADSDE